MKRYVPGDLRADQLVKVRSLKEDGEIIKCVNAIRSYLQCGLAEANDLRKRI